MIERAAHAKINLALHVTGQRDDGYHLLDTLVVFAEFGDVICIDKPHHPHGPLEVHLDGPFGSLLSSGGKNLVTNAAVILREAVKTTGSETPPVSIILEKNLPIASGIGGGSADAAATLIGLQEYWESDVDLFSIAKIIGADVPMCLLSKPLRANGIGDEISFPVLSEPLNLVLVNPSVEISTPEIFARLSDKNQSPISQDQFTHFPDVKNLQNLRNDLQAPAIAQEPVIGDVLDAIANSGAGLARMSGSGATCFGIYPSLDAAEEACAKIKNTNPGWWCVATKTTVS